MICLALPSTVAVAGPAAYITAQEVQAATKAAPEYAVSDEPMRVIDADPGHVGIFLVHRPKKRAANRAAAAGEAVAVTEGLQLNKVTVICQVLEGAGTLVTGGTLVNSKPMKADDPDLPLTGPSNRGTGIAGGESHHVSAGDTVIIPAGTSLGFSDIEEPITYLSIRVDPEKTLPRK